MWKLVRTGAPDISIDTDTFSPQPNDCSMSIYLTWSCEDDSNAVCESQEATCLSDGVVQIVSYSSELTADFSFYSATPDSDRWLFFDTDPGCQGTYEFSVTYEN